MERSVRNVLGDLSWRRVSAIREEIHRRTSSKWAKIMKCSQDTALCDIDDLITRRILVKDAAGGRSTS